MKEEFLHYLWKYSLYDPNSLTDNENNGIVVINPGDYNRDSGPDFFNARILIAGTEWAGNVEIHTKASHFNSHGHNSDHAFDNVILHVVAENDKKVFNSRNEELLTIEIKYDSSLYEKYSDLINNPCVIACQNEIGKFDLFFFRNWLHSLLIERLQAKSDAVMKIFAGTGNDWEETFYRMLTRYFGFRVNTEPFEMLANALPFKIIRKHSDNKFQIEALLFGTAGMLEEGLFKEALSDRYYKDLIKEYRVLKAKYSLQPLHGWIWKFSRLRPVNFPTVRISQLSAMLSAAGGLFSRTLETSEIRHLKSLFEVSASSYWDDHYVFGKKSREISKKTGNQATDIILINAVIPLIFIYGRFHNDQDICEKALEFLESTVPETNSVTRDWESAGVKVESAFYTQGLLQLSDEYCRKRRCLECRIGCRIISMGKSLINSNELMLEP
jgi:Protein of unknown function (DUF2851)